MVIIKNRLIPSKPRSKYYNLGSGGSFISGGTTVVSPATEKVQIIKENSPDQFTDENVLSALRSLLEIQSRIIKSDENVDFSDDNMMSALRSISEFIRKNKDDETNGIINFIKGIKVNGIPFTSLILEEDKTDASDSDVFSALRVLSEIASNNEDLKKLFLRKDVSDETQGHLTIQKGATLNGVLDANELINANSGIVAKSNQTSKELSKAILEETDEESSVMSTALLEDSSTIGVDRFVDLSDVDQSFDSAENGSYLLNKQDGVFFAERYYPETISPITINLHNSDAALWSILSSNKGSVFNGVVGDETYNLQVNWSSNKIVLFFMKNIDQHYIIFSKDANSSITREEKYITFNN